MEGAEVVRFGPRNGWLTRGSGGGLDVGQALGDVFAGNPKGEGFEGDAVLNACGSAQSALRRCGLGIAREGGMSWW